MLSGATRRFLALQSSYNVLPWDQGTTESAFPCTTSSGLRTSWMCSLFGNLSLTMSAARPMYSRNSSRTERNGQIKMSP